MQNMGGSQERKILRRDDVHLQANEPDKMQTTCLEPPKATRIGNQKISIKREIGRGDSMRLACYDQCHQLSGLILRFGWCSCIFEHLSTLESWRSAVQDHPKRLDAR